MINLTPAFKQKLFNDERDYLEYADITLENNTVLHLTNANFWQNGFSIEDSIGEDNTFSALGAAVVNSCTLVINNIYDDFTEYDFTNAKVVVSVGMELPNPQNPSTTYIERAWKGTFMVDEATYNGSLITLKCLDDMAQFDRPYSESTLTYPATLGEIVRNACSICLGSANDLGTQQFPHYDYEIPSRPEDEKVTFREVIGWCAAIAGCFARFSYYETANKSKLELKWFNQSVFEQRAEGTDGGEFDTNSTSRYTTGDTLDGGTFNPWNTGGVADAGNFTDERPFHHISSLYNHNISVDDVIITGIRTTVKDDDEDSSTETISEIYGTEGYVIDIADNDFVTKTNALEIRTWLGQQLIGLTFRKASVTHPSDPSIEAGDIAFVYDRKGNEYPILVTRTVFNGFGMQTTVCGASTPNRNSSTRYDMISKSYIDNRKKMKQQKKAYDEALEDLAEAVENAKGMYTTIEAQQGGGNIIYVHNKPLLAQSDVVIEVSNVGVTVTSNYSDPNPTWYGLTVTGDLVANLISALGINFEWAVGTTFTLGGTGNGNGILRVLDASDNEIGKWSKDGLIANSGGKITSKNGRVYFDLDNNEVACSKILDPTSSNKMVAFVGQKTLREKSGGNGRTYNGLIMYRDSTDPYPFGFGINVSDGSSPTTLGGTAGVTLTANSGTGGIAIGENGSVLISHHTNSLNIATESIINAKASYAGSAVSGNDEAFILIDSSHEIIINAYGKLALRGSPISLRGSNVDMTSAMASGFKSRKVETDNYNSRLLYCYEMASPIFGDVGEGRTDETGITIIDIDDIFSESISPEIEYQVFLQKEGEGDLWVSEKKPNYFVVKGTPSLKFSWEIKAIQRDFPTTRMEDVDKNPDIVESTEEDTLEIYNYFNNELDNYISNIERVQYETA